MNDKITPPNAPAIPGLNFRRLRGESDYPALADLINASGVADRIDRSISVEKIARNFRHLENCNPQTDMLFAEVDGQMIAHSRIHWEDMSDGIRLYILNGALHPGWRGKGIGTCMWEAAERRGRAIAAGHPKETPKYFHAEPFDSQNSLVTLLERHGYHPVRYEAHMVRDLSEPFPGAPMPPGLEVRSVKREHLRAIFDGSNEAFRDHWGTRDESEEEYKSQLENPEFHPELWKVAWDGDQMAGVVHNFIDTKENMEYHRQRGYTEGICTRRPWRKLGLARSLLVQSMEMFKGMGMAETALSVDAENISGALRLYEGVGYRKVKQQIIYRKPME